MKSKLFATIAVLVLCLSFPILAQARTFEGRVVGVKDGDSIIVLDNRTPREIRLAFIDCPEFSQAFGKRAKQFTSNWAYKKWVKVEVIGKGFHKRPLGIVTRKGRALHIDLLKNGLAWHAKYYSKDPYLAELELKARKERVGLWVDPKPVPPWEFRRTNRKKRAN